jgi:aspartyl protease family protein
MDDFDTGRLIYLLILLGAVLGSFIAMGRANLGKTAQQAAIWVLIFLGAIAAVGLWDDIRGSLAPRAAIIGDGRIEVPVAPDGHFYLTATVDGADITFVVDTGASDIVLTEADARAAGVPTENLSYTGRAQTANGTVTTAPVTLDSLTLGGVTDRAVSAVVNGGDLDTSLLGMAYLSRYRMTFSDRTLTLER